MEWEDFLNENVEYIGQIQTDIKCPKCGEDIYLDNNIVLTSYPEQYVYWCSCGWKGYSYRKWNKLSEELEMKFN